MNLKLSKNLLKRTCRDVSRWRRSFNSIQCAHVRSTPASFPTGRHSHIFHLFRPFVCYCFSFIPIWWRFFLGKQFQFFLSVHFKFNKLHIIGGDALYSNDMLMSLAAGGFKRNFYLFVYFIVIYQMQIPVFRPANLCA